MTFVTYLLGTIKLVHNGIFRCLTGCDHGCEQDADGQKWHSHIVLTADSDNAVVSQCHTSRFV